MRLQQLHALGGVGTARVPRSVAVLVVNYLNIGTILENTKANVKNKSTVTKSPLVLSLFVSLLSLFLILSLTHLHTLTVLI